MAITSLEPRLNLQTGKTHHQHGVVVEEIEGIIRVYKDGHVERPPIVPNVSCEAVNSELNVRVRDVVIDKLTNLWARIYVPGWYGKQQLPLLVYFHGGGFCVGSAAWSCYHEFLANLASKAGCVIMSVNYRLAPENRLPSAYEDGLSAVMWVKLQALLNESVSDDHEEQKWWFSRCNLSSMFLAGDSAGGNIAHNVATRLLVSSFGTTTTESTALKLKGTILIQPFFGGEARTESERHAVQPANSALTLSASDAYWRLSLPVGANRDHAWCNPVANSGAPAVMVCVSEMDILKDRNLELCAAMASAGKKVERVVYKGVGHAFQVLHNSQLSQTRTHELMSHLKAFINQY